MTEFEKKDRFKVNLIGYAMSEAGGASNFVREYTIASGGPYCDCGYKKK